MKLKSHQLNNWTQGHNLDPVLMVDFPRLLTITATVNVQHLTWAALLWDGSLFGQFTWPLFGSWPFSPHIEFKLRCFMLTVSPSSPSLPFPSFSPTQTHKHTHTRQHSLSRGSLINDRLSGKWHLWWLQHFWRTLFFNISYVEKMQMRTFTSEGSAVVFQITGVDAVWQKHTCAQQTLYKTF